MKPLPLNLGYDPECRSCSQGIHTYRSGQDEEGMGGIELRVFCHCVEPLPVTPTASAICHYCGHTNDAHKYGLDENECGDCECSRFVPVTP